MGRFYITTPIYYINGRPHVGHLYTTVAADVLARYERRRGKEVLFLAGTDENSQKTVDAAKKSGEDLPAYTDRLANIWKSAWRELGISNTDFIRTTEERHIKTVNEFWRRVWDRGDIYKGKYEGLYCVGHEAFLKETDLLDGVCPDHGTKPEKLSEENYFFKLSKYGRELLNLYESNPNFVTPQTRFNEIKSFVREGLEDISVSRETRKWGIPVPNDPKQVIYVWFDALINYVSAVGIEGWRNHPADVHMVGKDIARFHAVIWPAMLLSAGLSLPKQVVTNGFFTVVGAKISKSLGNAIDPLELKKTYHADALRYFLLREIPYGDDGDFSEAKLKERYNADLANGLGNFAARILTLGEKLGQIDPKVGLDSAVEKKITETRTTVNKKIEEYKFHESVAALWDLISFGDEYVNSHKPWETNDHKVIFNLVVLLDNIASILSPFLPETAEKITRCIAWADGTIKINRGEVLFPRSS